MGNKDEHKHHILSERTSLITLLVLLGLTVITVWVSRIDFGAINFVIAAAIACIKALLVVLFFMGLKYDENENRVIFFSSLFFVFVFIALTAADVFDRGLAWRAQGPLLKEVANAGQPSKFKKPWVASEELKAHGKTIFQVQCVMCHGESGQGNGVAATSLNPKPRNFTSADGWKNGRKVTDIFLTLTNGLNTMPSFATLSTDDRWALVHYVSAFGPANPEATNEDLKKAGILDASKDDGGMSVNSEPKIPADFAIERYLTKKR